LGSQKDDAGTRQPLLERAAPKPAFEDLVISDVGYAPRSADC